jgi:hypothetical protein
LIAGRKLVETATPVAQGIVDWFAQTIEDGIDGWRKATEAFGALVGYSWDAVVEGRWEDARRALNAWQSLPGALAMGILDAYNDAPLLAQAGISMAPGGDALDLAIQGRNLVTGQQVDWLVTGLSVFGLASDVGWLDLFAPDPVDGTNAALGLAKSLLKQLPAGPARDALQQMLRNPAEYGRLLATLRSIWNNRAALRALEDSPEVVVWLLRNGPEAAETLARYGHDGVALVERAPRLAEEMIRFLTRTPDAAGDLVSRASDGLEAAERLAQVGLVSDEAGPLIGRIVEGSTHGSGDRVVLGPWVNPSRWADEGGGYVEEAIEHGGIYFETPPGLFDALGRDSKLAWAANREFLRTQLTSGRTIQYVGDVADALRTSPLDSMRRREIEFLLDHASEFGYELVGNNWIKVR